MAIQLLAHNMQAYQGMHGMTERHSKVAIIHPTGTGKSLSAFKWIEEYANQRFVGLSPSDYICKTQIENVRRSTPDFPAGPITFPTYARLTQMTDDELPALKSEGVILDEFYRFGAKGWVDGATRFFPCLNRLDCWGYRRRKFAIWMVTI